MSADVVIGQLDAELAQRDPNIGIRMGLDLYRDCIHRGLITLEIFSVQGTGLLAQEVTAYRKTHAVVYWPDYQDWQFRVGQRNP